MIYAVGTENSGLSLFVQGDRLVFDYNCFGEHHVVRSTRPVPTGDCVLGVELRRSGRGGVATLVVDGEPAGSVELPFVMQVISSIGPSVGRDHGSQVSDLYRGPSPFTGTIDRVDVQLVSARSPEVAASEHDADAAADERRTLSQQ